ncbi:MAG: hypothetical protein U9Q63_02040 [Patescibacteria group bacterium]|nr:hypothetical protein [Patescibacteria group bacterium]
MKKVGISIFLLIGLLVLPPFIYAKKKITRTHKSKIATQTKYPNTPWTKLKLRTDKNSLILAMGNLKFADQIDYTLTYSSQDIKQGISGSLNLEKTSQQKELLFGTCSGTNCTYHQDIKDMIFEIITQLKSGKTLIRRYQINP